MRSVRPGRPPRRVSGRPRTSAAVAPPSRTGAGRRLGPPPRSARPGAPRTPRPAPGHRARRGRRASADRTRGWSRSWPRRSPPAPGRPVRAAGPARSSSTASSSSATSSRHRHRGAGGSPTEHLGELSLQPDQPVEDPDPELVGRHPPEGDHHQLVQLDVALGDVARGQGGDRVRLARAGARLEHGGAGRQRTVHVERGRRRGGWRAIRSRPGPRSRPPRHRCSRRSSRGSSQLLHRRAGAGRRAGPACRTGWPRPGCRAPPRVATRSPRARPG